MSEKETFVLIDGNSLVNRAFYALPPLNNKAGVPTQAVYGFTTMLVKAITDYRPTQLAVAFDLPQPTFRHIRYEGYKATRKKMPEELAVQIPLLKTMLGIMGIRVLEKPGFEADDIIGTMAKKSGGRVIVVTGDRDALQLIDDKIQVLMTKRGLSETVLYDATRLKTDYQLTPCQIVDYKSLSGDASDNIPGIAGIGEKTATQLLSDYGSLNGVYCNLSAITGKLKERIENGKENAYLSYELATIHTAVPLDAEPQDCVYPFPFSRDVKQFFIDNGFQSLVKRGELFGDTAQQSETARPEHTAQVTIVKDREHLLQVSNSVASAGSVAVVVGADSIRFAAASDVEYAVSVTHSLIDPGLDYGEVLCALKPIFESPKVCKAVLCAKSFKKTLAPFGIELNHYFDVRIAQYLVDATATYENIGDILCANGFSSETPAAGLFGLQTALTEQMKLLNLTALYVGIELPLSDILYRMEREGFRVDTEKLKDLGADFSARAEKFSADIQAAAGYAFNVNSPKQLAKALFEDMKIPYPKKSGSFSTAAEILEQIADEHPVIQKILAYRFLSKLNGTYVEGLLKAADVRGIVRTDFKQTLTATGRLSSAEPNLQNIPIREEEGRLLRVAFIPKTAGDFLICADYSQIELRLMAHFSSDANMLAAYQNDEDIHATTAAGVFGVPLSEVTAKMRREAKAVNFGIIYGISDFGLAKNLGVSVATARRYIENYFARFPGVKAYMESAIALAKKKGYAETLFGRIRKIPELLSPNFNTRSFGERVAMNTPLQGSAADIIKIAMVNVDRALIGKKSKLILQVHDELIVDAAASEADEVVEILRNGMENAASLRVPLVADIGKGRNWYECK